MSGLSAAESSQAWKETWTLCVPESPVYTLKTEEAPEPQEFEIPCLLTFSLAVCHIFSTSY